MTNESPRTSANDDAYRRWLVDLPPPAVGDDRWDICETPQTLPEAGQVERALVAVLHVPRERRRRLRGILDHFWSVSLTPGSLLWQASLAAASGAPTPWKSPAVLLTAEALAEHFVCSLDMAKLERIGQPADVLTWRLAFWLDDDGRPLPPPVVP